MADIFEEIFKPHNNPELVEEEASLGPVGAAAAIFWEYKYNQFTHSWQKVSKNNPNLRYNVSPAEAEAALSAVQNLNRGPSVGLVSSIRNIGNMEEGKNQNQQEEKNRGLGEGEKDFDNVDIEDVEDVEDIEDEEKQSLLPRNNNNSSIAENAITQAASGPAARGLRANRGIRRGNIIGGVAAGASIIGSAGVSNLFRPRPISVVRGNPDPTTTTNPTTTDPNPTTTDPDPNPTTTDPNPSPNLYYPEIKNDNTSISTSIDNSSYSDLRPEFESASVHLFDAEKNQLLHDASNWVLFNFIEGTDENNLLQRNQLIEDHIRDLEPLYMPKYVNENIDISDKLLKRTEINMYGVIQTNDAYKDVQNSANPKTMIDIRFRP